MFSNSTNGQGGGYSSNHVVGRISVMVVFMLWMREKGMIVFVHSVGLQILSQMKKSPKDLFYDSNISISAAESNNKWHYIFLLKNEV